MMKKIDQAKLYRTQISLSEWFEGIDHSKSEALRLEDNEKRERLKKLNEIIGLPFDKPTKFSATDIEKQADVFKKFLQQHKTEFCALRLIPIDPKLPKLRIRGCTIADSLKWFNEQKVDHQKYRVEFVPHSEHQLWATIFIVNKQGIFGEITHGGHYQLTQGFYDDGEPIDFAFDFKKLNLSKSDPEAKKQLQKIIKAIKVDDLTIQKKLVGELNATFSNGYLEGYFETTAAKKFGLWFIDYNRILGEIYDNFSVVPFDKKGPGIRGSIACPGKISGTACVITPNNMSRVEINENDVLICQMTTPDYLPLMKKAGAVVTDMGGILSHSAIICRELNKPCITNTKTSTKIFKSGDLLEVDANTGIVRKIANAN